MTQPSKADEPFRVSSLTGSVYVPGVLYAIGQGAATPMIALVALDLGASPAVAGAIVALRGIGTLFFDIPAGSLVARVGERRAMLIATGALTLIALGIGLGPTLPMYAVLVFLMGGAWSIWALARLAFATEVTPPRHRGRVMSMVGGTMRIGQFVGPLLGGLVVIPFGLAGPFFAQALLAAIAALSLGLAPEPPTAGTTVSIPSSLRQVLREHRRTLGTAGIVAVTFQLLRTARQAIIPLWGDHIGLSASQISLIFGLSSGIEMIIFYPVGMLMDRKGRRWAAIPSLLLLSLGLALIPLTSEFIGLLVVSLFIGLANGLGSGINLTLGSDLSPEAGRSQFFGLWRLISDVGTAGGPLLVAVVTSLVSLAAAPIAVAAVGLAGAAVMWRSVPETLQADLG
jgi:MFS family permease